MVWYTVNSRRIIILDEIKEVISIVFSIYGE